MKPMKSCLLFCVSTITVLISTIAGAQTPVATPSPCIQQACYFATTALSLGSSAATTLTVQEPATTPARQVQFTSAVVQCSGQAFSVDQSQNGTGASATAGTAVPLIPIATTLAGGGTVAATAKVFTASNVGAGTATAPTLSYTAGDPRVIDLSPRTMGGAGITNNYSVKVTNNGGSSCNAVIAIYWWEKL